MTALLVEPIALGREGIIDLGIDLPIYNHLNSKAIIGSVNCWELLQLLTAPHPPPPPKQLNGISRDGLYCIISAI